MIVDAQGRRFRNLRVSLTAACNYACEYCVPNGKRLVAAAGIEKLRITGGEPLVSPKFDQFLPAVMRQPLRDVSITTNGQLLEK